MLELAVMLFEFGAGQRVGRDLSLLEAKLDFVDHRTSLGVVSLIGNEGGMRQFEPPFWCLPSSVPFLMIKGKQHFVFFQVLASILRFY